MKQQSDDTVASTYSNRGDTTDFDDDPIRYLLSDDDEDEESTLVISKVERSNARVRQNGNTGSQRSLTDDEVFSVRENVERMTVNPNQAAKLMVQGMREQLTPFQYNGTPFPVRRQESDPNSQESSSDIKVCYFF